MTLSLIVARVTYTTALAIKVIAANRTAETRNPTAKIPATMPVFKYTETVANSCPFFSATAFFSATGWRWRNQYLIAPPRLDYLWPALQNIPLRTAVLARPVRARQELITLHLYVQYPHMTMICQWASVLTLQRASRPQKEETTIRLASAFTSTIMTTSLVTRALNPPWMRPLETHQALIPIRALGPLWNRTPSRMPSS